MEFNWEQETKVHARFLGENVQAFINRLNGKFSVAITDHSKYVEPISFKGGFKTMDDAKEAAQEACNKYLEYITIARTKFR